MSRPGATKTLRRPRPGRAVLAGALAAAVLVSLYLLFGSPLRERDRTWERIQSEGVMRVGLDASFPPFEMMDPETGAIVGLDVDLAEALGEELGGLRVEFLNVGFDSLYDQLLAGRYDLIISALPVDYMWTEDVRYSQPYFHAGLVMVTRRELAEAIDGPGSLVRRRVGVEWGSEGDAYVRRLEREEGEVDVHSYPSPAEALAALDAGEVEVCLVDAVSAYQWLKEYPQMTVAGEPLTDVAYAVAMRRDSPVLARQVDQALARLKETGVLEELLSRWF